MLALAGLVIGILDLGCWLICFYWMHQISNRQNAVLEELRQQGARIERVSNEEHKIIKELHPAVGEIKEGMGELREHEAASLSGQRRNLK
jgi:hypothetical protein